jgi:predicted aminopeptidase
MLFLDGVLCSRSSTSRDSTYSQGRCKTWLMGLVFVLILAIGSTGCSIGYVVNAAVVQSRILLRRQPIETLLDSSSPEIAPFREKLTLVLSARDYAQAINLDCGAAFTTYSPFEGEALSWVVAATPPLELKSKTWWFPVVGSVPYKGFFKRADAIKAGEELEAQGYEVVVRGVTAFSTLGWFDDPVLTPLLKNDPVQIVNVVLHENVHSTTWIPHSVEFNESLAHFVALEETIRYFESEYCTVECQQRLEEAKRVRQAAFSYAQNLSALHSRLTEIFQSSHSTPEKLALKREAYEYYLGPSDDQPKNLGANKHLAESANNAEFMQEYIYHHYFDCFERFRESLPTDSSAHRSTGAFLDELVAHWASGKFAANCAAVAPLG